MKIFETERDSIADIRAALSADNTKQDIELEHIVREIIKDVRLRGDIALIELGKRFDSPELSDIVVTEEEFDEAYSSIDKQLLESIRIAKSNIESFHRKQLHNSWIEMSEDFVYGQIVRPIEKVGFYAPGGTAPLISTVLMTAIPAKVAGVPEVVMCTPAQKNGKASGPMLVAARECGVNIAYKIGGAQAIAAMAYGTDSVVKVDKIVGPGNPYVTEAKRQLFGIVGIDQLAGPSEILIIADDSANPEYVAADMLSQAEHATDSRCVLVTTSRRIADETLREIKIQTQNAPRKEYIEKSLDDFGVIILAASINECVEFANLFAPEHLELAVENPWEILKLIKNAGTIMVGHYTPVPLCDFAAGPNHTLPTGGTARFSSALSVDDFIKKSGLLSYNEKALNKIAPVVLEMARAEGLDAHANTVRVRIEKK